MTTTISTEQATDMLRAEGYATADITAAMNSFIAADAPAEDESGEWAWTAEDLGVLRRVLGRLGRRAARAYARKAEMTTYQLTDKITDAAVIVAGHDVEEALREWNPEAPDDVLQACTDLGAAVMAGTYTGDLEALLQVEVMQIA